MKAISGSRKDHLIRLSIFLITIALVAGVAGCFCTPPSKNLEIWTWYDLDAVRNNMEGNHILMNDLDSATAGYEELASPTANGGKGWEPIGFEALRQPPTEFRGTFDGQGHRILGLFIDRPDEMGVGLFSVAWGLIRDVLVVNATVTGGIAVGGLVGDNVERSIVSNCYCSGEIAGDERVGGLVGNNIGPVKDSYFAGSVSGNSYVGGLIGFNGDAASNCHSAGSVTGGEQVGGLLGYHNGIVINSYSTSSVTGNEYVGGLVGRSFIYYEKGTVSNSLWDTETSGQATSEGGMGKTTAEMMNIATFSGAGWNITTVADSDTRNTGYIWNIVDGETYPFLSWQWTA